VGTAVKITGVSLTQTKSVTFGSVKATTFTVNSDKLVRALWVLASVFMYPRCNLRHLPLVALRPLASQSASML
jgi:hypothetical protein